MSISNIDYIIYFATAFLVFLIIDGIWLAFIARRFYARALSGLLRSRPNWSVAFLFYALFVAGLLVFVLIPALNDNSIEFAAKMGALYGFFTYMTYDLTNLATIKNWPLKVTVVDIIWGSCLASLVSVLTVLLLT